MTSSSRLKTRLSAVLAPAANRMVRAGKTRRHEIVPVRTAARREDAGEADSADKAVAAAVEAEWEWAWALPLTNSTAAKPKLNPRARRIRRTRRWPRRSRRNGNGH